MSVAEYRQANRQLLAGGGPDRTSELANHSYRQPGHTALHAGWARLNRMIYCISSRVSTRHVVLPFTAQADTENKTKWGQRDLPDPIFFRAGRAFLSVDSCLFFSPLAHSGPRGTLWSRPGVAFFPLNVAVVVAVMRSGSEPLLRIKQRIHDQATSYPRTKPQVTIEIGETQLICRLRTGE